MKNSKIGTRRLRAFYHTKLESQNEAMLGPIGVILGSETSTLLLLDSE